MDAAATRVLGGLYLVSGFAIAASYIPQLARGWRHPEATVVAQSFSSWAVWAACRAVALLYGILVVEDALFIVAVGLDLLGRILVLAVLLRALALQRRRKRHHGVSGLAMRRRMTWQVANATRVETPGGHE